ncbi:hypothetical protein MNBD_NITROSPIRAE01-586 [hydrothermal vent metagenome]|uniref:Phospholipase/carboxylesterase/thioesterase domain-containing protein n=1 Tax=hydrothermal vent metagenome TaxID=652676 RepID=A0A3B1CPK1_9ZZZZ
MKKILPLILVLVFAQWWFTDPSIRVSSHEIRFKYVVKYSGNASRADDLPMLVALHGNGDTADNFYETALDQLKVPARIILFQGPIPYGRGNAWPWSPDDFSQYGKAFTEAVDALALKYPTLGRPILFGFSGGGMMAYYQALKHGDRYAYIFPVSGRLSKNLLGDEAIRIGAEVIAFHGMSDSVVSINGGKEAVALLRKSGTDVIFSEFKGGHLEIFTTMKSTITEAIEEKIKDMKKAKT